ncbi:MAG: helix-turn-helix domain-containing protein [Mangrovibacterium sp.]
MSCEIINPQIGFGAKREVTQQELASRIGTSKSYISKIEKGLVEPGVGTFYRIMNSLGLRIEIVKQLSY